VIFLLCSITLNNAQAKFLFKARIDYSAGENPYFVDIGDLNGDGAPDLAVTTAFYTYGYQLWCGYYSGL
jgi:hypothetical protein